MKGSLLLASAMVWFPLVPRAQIPLPLEVGETLHYESRINLIPAGSARLEVSALEALDGDSVYHIVFSVQTNPVLDRIFKIRDRIETWIDAKGLFTRKFAKKIREGNYRHQFSATINYEDSVVTTARDSFSIDRELRDPYSLFYYLRTLPLNVGDLLGFTTFDNGEFIDFQVTVHHRESVRVPAGVFRCLVIEPFKEGASLLKNEGDMTIWLSDDDQRLPVKIVSRAKFGSMVFKLKSLSRRDPEPVLRGATPPGSGHYR
ncbi:MAG: DUF3108 domain-containing protein [Fidelibacterota bacterium]